MIKAWALLFNHSADCDLDIRTLLGDLYGDTICGVCIIVLLTFSGSSGGGQNDELERHLRIPAVG